MTTGEVRKLRSVMKKAKYEERKFNVVFKGSRKLAEEDLKKVRQRERERVESDLALICITMKGNDGE